MENNFAGRNQTQVLGVLIVGEQPMFILKVHWDFRMLWAVLTVSAKFYICCLAVATGYSLVFLIRTAYRSHGLSKHGAASDSPQKKHELIKMAKGIENVRQLLTLLFFLFGVFCTNEIYAAVRAIQDSRMSLSALGFEAFGPVIAFAFCTFITFAGLHSLQWIVAARLQSNSIDSLCSLDIR
jgi:hypothetical protein